MLTVSGRTAVEGGSRTLAVIVCQQVPVPGLNSPHRWVVRSISVGLSTFWGVSKPFPHSWLWDVSQAWKWEQGDLTASVPKVRMEATPPASTGKIPASSRELGDVRQIKRQLCQDDC